NALEQKSYHAWIFRDFDAERRRYRIGGDVVMRRADAAGREKIIVTLAQRIDRRDNLSCDIGNHARLAEIDADLAQLIGDIGDVLVLRAAGQDLVAYDKDRRRDGCRLRHDLSPDPGKRLIFGKGAEFLDRIMRENLSDRNQARTPSTRTWSSMRGREVRLLFNGFCSLSPANSWLLSTKPFALAEQQSRTSREAKGDSLNVCHLH